MSLGVRCAKRIFLYPNRVQRLGLYGFGAAAHIHAPVAHHQGRRIYAFTRAHDVEAQQFARERGAVWAGASDAGPPEELDGAILFAPVGALVPAALRAVVRGGTVVCAGIHMSDISSFPYRLLWAERCVRSVANLTRRDGEDYLALASQIPVRTEVQTFPLSQANEALVRLREGRIRGAAVLIPDSRFVSEKMIADAVAPANKEVKNVTFACGSSAFCPEDRSAPIASCMAPSHRYPSSE